MKLTIRLVFALGLPLFLLTGAIALVANSSSLYQHEFTRHNVSERTGLSSDELSHVADEFIHYFNSDEELLDITIEREDEVLHLFSERELEHMKDVKPLIRLDYYVLAGCTPLLLGFTLWGLLSGRGQNRRELASAAKWGGVVTLALIVALGLFAALGFDQFFTSLHVVFFGDTTSWVFSPQDYLIRLFPEGFFFDMALICTGISALLGAVIVAIGVIYERVSLSQ